MESLNKFINSNPDPRELKRAIAVKMSLQGYTHSKIMAILGVSSGFISTWKVRFEADGVAGIKLAYKGGQGYLGPIQKQAVIDWLKAKADWNLRELKHHLAERYGVVFQSKQSYYDLFKEAGISWKKSQKRQLQKKPALVAAQKELSS
ncbi:MAG: winged helix-turn-helix domain-containing protein [Pseudanabaenales cyanobacterium]|nr:winged helix-turn-helix domain-containing protein [Pseudanabaenales cyanobacterium]